MPDYGHELILGTFITPSAADPGAVVELAELTESAGLDAATFQDHPYNPDFLDTWTLLTWVAARTSRILVSANVLSLPLRLPTLLARQAASLDLLSGGRFELGLGSGAFWGPIHGMGGPQRTPGQGVDALSEGIDIIRSVWDDSEPGPLRFNGEHYSVPGMKRGPRPAHDIGIWLGAYKPRMLRLTGRKADGWLPSLGYLQLDDIEDSNRVIDEAASAAGRDPRAVRRLLNLGRVAFSPVNRGFLQGPPEQWVEELLPLVLEHGFSAFFIGGDDPRSFQILGQEVAPALREAVAKERASAGTKGGPPSSALKLSRRASDIDYDALPASLASKVVEPGDPTYERVRHSYTRAGSPGLVIRGEDNADIAAALAFARSQDVPLSIRSGGHGFSGRSTNDGGIIIDLAKMDRAQVLDRARKLVRIEAGARWSQIAEKLAWDGLAITSGDYGGVGAGGLATAGGIGYMVRKYGLTIDRMVAAEVVIADGSLLRVDAENQPDLFWAIRGAGANFGIVTAFELVASEVGDVIHANITVDATDTSSMLQEWGRLVEAAPREVTSFLWLAPPRDGNRAIAQITLVYAGDDVDAGQKALTPFLGVAPILDQQAQLLPYQAAIVGSTANPYHRGHGVRDSRSGLLEHITLEAGEAIENLSNSGEVLFTQFRSVGGAVNDIPADATAYPHRTQNFSIISGSMPDRRAGLDAHWAQLHPHLNGLYASFESDPSPDRLLDAFPEPTLSRLRALKAVYDPDEVFDQNFNVTPAVTAVR